MHPSSPSIRLIAIDIDDTLVHNSIEVSAANREAIQAAQERGIIVILATARHWHTTQFIATQLGMNTPLICFSGACIRMPDGSELLNLPLSLDDARVIAEFADSAGYPLLTTIDGVNYHPAGLGERLRLPVETSAIVTKNTEALAYGAPLRIMIHEHDLASHLYTELAERLGNRLAFKRTMQGERMYAVTITAANATKGQALVRLCEHLGIPLETTMAIGDNEADISMIETAGLGVAVGNAPPDVQAAACVIAPPAWEDGVAWAIHRFVLKR